jgi:hypothetical protein
LEGEKIFSREDVGCARCHVPPRYTDSRLPGPDRPAAGPVAVFPGASSRITAEGFLVHDVGTLKETSGKRLGAELAGMDTPTLQGIWETGPYLHDGGAATVMDVLTTANAGDRHGKTSHLSAAEKEDLAAFLLQLDGNGKDGTAGVRRTSPAPRGRLTSLREGRWLGLRGLLLQGPVPEGLTGLRITDAKGRFIADLGAGPGPGAWRTWKGPGGSGYFLPWSQVRARGRPLEPGIYLIHIRGRCPAATLKVILASGL